MLAALRDGDAPVLAEACATPLNLWLVRTVYVAGRVDPTPLLDHADATTLRAALLGQLIPAVIAARPPSRDPDDPLLPRRRWDPDDVRRWLSLLARQLNNAGTRDLLWWHLARRTLNPWLGGLAFGLMFGLVFGLPVALVLGLALVPPVGLAFVLAFGLITKEQITASEPKRVNLQWHGRAGLLARQLALWLPVELALGLPVGLAFGLVREPPVGLATGLAFGLAFGLVFGPVVGLCRWMETSSTTDRAGTPSTSRSSDRAVTVIRTASIGLAGGVAGGAAGGVAGGLIFGLVGLMTAGGSAWLCHVLAARWSAVTGRLPWRLMGFLDDAYRLGLLRIVGPAYQFRHAELQDYLAASRSASKSDAGAT